MSIAASVRGGAMSALAALLIVLGTVSPAAAHQGGKPGGSHCRPGQHQAGGDRAVASRCVRAQSRKRAPDTTPPQTTITSGPSGTITTSSTTFAFSSSESRSTYECSADGSAWQSCPDPKSYTGLADGTHVFDVRAVDASGNVDPTPAADSYAVQTASTDTTPPETTITSGPSGTITTSSASFAFDSSESGSTFACRMDGAAWGGCTSPKSYSGLANGAHTFDVRATDSANNTDASPASRAFTVDVAQPPTCQPAPAQLVAPGCPVLKSDIGATSNAASLWGNVECATSTRAQLLGSGGDPHQTASGAPQGNAAFWELNLVDGDDFYGERCELGRNEWRNGYNSGTSGTFMVYPEGAHRITFASYRFPSSFPFTTSNWQTILQMKQAQPSNNGGGSPIIEIQLRNGRLWLESPTTDYWSTPVSQGVWERIALDVRYSQDPNVGTITMYIDLNGDGDAADPGEQSPVIHTATLKTETSGPLTYLQPGDSIPSHLRMGLYHDPTIGCSPGCAVDVDNVQVVDL
jgi:Polysaccharide lyase